MDAYAPPIDSAELSNDARLEAYFEKWNQEGYDIESIEAKTEYKEIMRDVVIPQVEVAELTDIDRRIDAHFVKWKDDIGSRE